MRNRPLLALLPLVVAAACMSPPVPVERAQRIRGSVAGLDRPETARIDVYRMLDARISVRWNGTPVTPATDGSFATSLLRPGRYLLALRAPDRPVSVVTMPVPPAPPARLVARRPLGAASLELRHELPGVDAVDVLLCHVEKGVPVTDRRTATVRAGTATVLAGLTPGHWQLDVVGAGATTEIVIPDTAERRTLTLAPPAIGTAATMMGRVFREDGSPAPGVAVTLRSRPEGSAEPAAWARSAVTDSDGGYRLVGLQAGRALLRLECRDAVHSRLPPARTVEIPPSGVVRRSFVVGP